MATSTSKLVIVESPGKIKSIQNYLGKDYEVVSCYGHVRDLPKKERAVDVEKGFQPHYVINEDKKDVVARLSKLAKKVNEVLLASDHDREGESIAWHLEKALELNEKQVKRIVFREITAQAIQEAIAHPRKIDMDLVHSQQARRILDRLVGYDLSPLLWRKIKPGLSAGRVQTVAVRLVVERERQILHFTPEESYQVKATFGLAGGLELEGGLKESLPSYEEAHTLLKNCQKATFTITDIRTKKGTENPSAPFTTSTLQQVASQKLGYSVARTMVLAQQLYEAGHITYMRTDSVTLSEQILSQTEKEIVKNYGKEYHHLRHYQTKTKGAQEAHEAIRPTDIKKKVISKEKDQQRLYQLIWRRTLASQMASTQLERTTVHIKPNTSDHIFFAKGEIVTFDGFLVLYDETATKAKKALPKVEKGTMLSLTLMQARQQFSKPSARYTEASLVRELEAKGIGRPSTYAPIIDTIQKRNYVIRESREGRERGYQTITLTDGKITQVEEKEIFGREKNKLFPTDIALSVTDYLVKQFSDITNYEFTAHMEEKLDKVAHKEQKWQKMLEEFYKQFEPKVKKASEQDAGVELVHTLGKDPKSGKTVYARLSKRSGPLVQLGEIVEGEEKPRFASLRPGQLLETLTLEDALFLLQLPRTVGTFEGSNIIAQRGRYGPYLYLEGEKKYYSLDDTHDVYTIQEAEAIEVIKAKRVEAAQSLLKKFPEEPTLEVRKGRFGPYIKADSGNYKIPKDVDAEKLTLEACKKIIEEAPPRRKGKRTRRK